MSFQITALPISEFQHLFSLDTEALASQGAIRVTATFHPGFPCRVSLEDASIGEEILLVHYEHHKTSSPFRASHAVYVRPDAAQAQLALGEVPVQLKSRTLSLRGFDRTGMLIEAALTEGANLAGCLTSLFAEPNIDYIHIHYAKAGCYAAAAIRAIFDQ